MTQWGVVRVLAIAAATMTSFTAITAALQGETLMAVLFGAVTVWNIYMYMGARGR